MSKIKKSKLHLNRGKRFEVKEETIEEMPQYDYPIFCFKHLHKDYHLEKCQNDEKKALIERIVKLSQMTWQEIQNADRHGFGSEKISISSIRPKCPSFITDEVKFLLALRFKDKAPFLGWKNGFIFHVIFIDRDFKVYPH